MHMIVFEDSQILVCRKPAGVVSEDGGLPALLKEQRGLPELYCVHRLDRETSGLMVYAKTGRAAAALSAAIAAREMRKEYLAVVPGEAPAAGEWRDLLYRDRQKNKSYVVKRTRRGVREAVLRFETLARQGGFCLVRIELETGRSHQIRVQFASRGFPLVGDGKYGSERENRVYGEKGQALCSWKLKFAFTTPAGALEYLNGRSFRAPVPEFAVKYFPSNKID